MKLAAAHRPSRTECAALRTYGVTTVLANLAWEAAQMPLYTLWETGTPDEIVFAILHCTTGDLLIASFALGLAILLSGRRTGLSPIAQWLFIPPLALWRSQRILARQG